MAKNLNFYFDNNGVPRARGKHSEKLLMSFLESDVQGSEYICHDLMNDITAIEDESVDSREFIGNAHCVTITAKGVTIASNIDDTATSEQRSSDGQQASGSSGNLGSSGSSGSSGEDNTHRHAEEQSGEYSTSLKHFQEILADWEAFILDEHDPIDDSMHV